jgi:galactose mutarotase-like enzyme
MLGVDLLNMDIEIKNNNWYLKVCLNGGRASNLEKNKQKILGTFSRIDGKIGNTHLCCPNFANEGVEKYGLPFHGPSRNDEWKVSEQSENSLTIFYEMKKIGSYPGLLRLEQKYKLEECFKQTILIKNLTEDKIPVNLGIHNYFECKFGWQGIKMNGIDLSEIVKASGYVKLNNVNKIEIPGKKNINWKQTGFKYAKLWTGFKEENGKKVFDKDYVCIEPVRNKEGFLDTEESKIDSNKVLKFEQSFFYMNDLRFVGIEAS